MAKETAEPRVLYWACPNEEASVLAKIKAFFTCVPSANKKTAKGASTNACRILGVTVLVGFLLFSITGCIIMWFTELYLDSINNAMTLKEGSEVFEAWRAPPVKPLICGYVFNYTNVEEYRTGRHDKIHVQEVGPYCYRETQEKINIEFNDDGTITYGDTRQHKFEPNYSNGTQDDILVVPNMALISLVAMSKNLNYFSRLILNSLLKRVLEYSHTMIKVRAHDYFFGYDDKLVGLATDAAKLLQHDVPFEKFGLLSRRATVTDDTITVHTGTGDLDKIGVVTEVNGEGALKVWTGDECNRIDGSDGAFFPRSDINETATLYLFHNDLCRRMPFVFDKEVEFQDGVMGMRFHAAPDVYDTNGTCYCPETGCAPNGVFDLSPCSFDAPIMMSFPHFLYADPSVREPFEGLHPDPEKHEFYIDIQRLLGFTLGTVSRLQLNMKIVKPRGFTMLKEFPEGIILPIVWLQVSAEKLPPDLFNYVYHSSITVRRFQVGLKWGSLVSTILSASILIYIYRKWSKQKETKNIKTQCDQELVPMRTSPIVVA